MSDSRAKPVPSVGFLTILRQPERGAVGGLLVLNLAGRPLEFHCTAPVRPNRAQEILYGATLDAYLYGEQIGQTLLSKVRSEPLLVCTDVAAALGVREFVAPPVVLVGPKEEGESSTVRIDGSHGEGAAAPAGLLRFRLGGCELAVAADRAADRDEAVRRWEPHARGFDLREPFQRIREAIDEAQRAAR